MAAAAVAAVLAAVADVVVGGLVVGVDEAAVAREERQPL